MLALLRRPWRLQGPPSKSSQHSIAAVAIITFQPPRRIFDRRLLNFVDNPWPGVGKIAAPGHKHGARVRGAKLRGVITKT